MAPPRRCQSIAIRKPVVWVARSGSAGRLRLARTPQAWSRWQPPRTRRQPSSSGGSPTHSQTLPASCSAPHAEAPAGCASTGGGGPRVALRAGAAVGVEDVAPGPGAAVVAAGGGLPLVARGQPDPPPDRARGPAQNATASSNVTPVAGWSARCGAASRARGPRPGGPGPAPTPRPRVRHGEASDQDRGDRDVALLAGLAEPVAALREDTRSPTSLQLALCPRVVHVRSGRDAVLDPPYRPSPAQVTSGATPGDRGPRASGPPRRPVALLGLLPGDHVAERGVEQQEPDHPDHGRQLVVVEREDLADQQGDQDRTD